jgi:hypothetical protein
VVGWEVGEVEVEVVAIDQFDIDVNEDNTNPSTFILQKFQKKL